MTLNGNGSGPPPEPPEDDGQQQPQEESNKLSKEVADLLMTFVKREMSSLLTEIPQLVRDELVKLVPEIQKDVVAALQQQPAPQLALSPSGEPTNGVAQAAAPSISPFMEKADLFLQMVDKATEKWFDFKKISAQTSIDVNPLATAAYLQEHWPTVMAMHSPNPLGEGFQQIFTQSTLNGMNIMAKAMRESGLTGPLLDNSPSPIAAPPSAPANPSSAQLNGLTSYEQDALKTLLSGSETGRLEQKARALQALSR